ncbi:hypothetical protein EMWEY_00060360 [Eimeria maxima]|uniref:Uncharacterized protein n=1 Tax=Eimeria maxima TaxID=5804 RepID=U6MB54_EIMMA|nr:hypothetical protein EMWEY_00060360 [Eimeria maxima]CDJ60283.1 hypothetical protein EMWEY_00060360 [Eimeria maxima]
MAVQGKGAVRTWLDWLSPEQGAGDAIHLSGEQNIENTNQTAPEEGVFVLRKFIGKQVGVTRPLLVVFSLLLLSAVLFRVSSRWNSTQLSTSRLNLHIEWDPQFLYDNIIWSYLDDLNDAEEQMNEAWSTSDQSVRIAFQKHFAPSLNDGQAPTEDPLATINDHVSKMRECEFPFDSSAKVQSDFLQHLQLLLSICRTVTLRLEELKSTGTWEKFNGGQLSFPVREDADSNSYRGDTFSISGSMEAKGFLSALGMVGSERRESVDAQTAEELVELLLAEDKHSVCNMEARYYFERFLQPFGDQDVLKATPSTAEHQIPYNGKPFRTGALAQAAAQVFRQSESNYRWIHKLHKIAGNWTPNGLLEASRQQEEENLYNFQQRLRIKRGQMRMLLKKGIQYGDLEMIALFLL